MLKRTLYLLFALIILCISPQEVSALTPEQKRVIQSGSLYFNVERTSRVCSTDSVNLIGSDNIERVYNFFLGKGFSANQAAGIAGNAMAESTGDPTIVSASGNYSGLFQWDTNGRFAQLRTYATSNGLDPLSLEAQLAYAYEEASKRYTQVSDKSVSNIDGVKKQTTVDMAAWYWGRFFEVAIIGGSTSETPLTNVQHLDKRIEYAKEILATYGGSSPAASGGASTSSCVGGNGEDTQYIDGFTVYSQYDPAWADRPYGSSTIAISGCGPAAMAMIITALGGKQVTPIETADYAGSIGMYQPGVGSSWAIGPELADHWGLKSEPVARDISAITEALRAGKLVIAPGAGAKPFTSGGHFIVIRGITADGKFKVGDSGHNDTSAQDWDPELIISNMRDGGSYAIYK